MGLSNLREILNIDATFNTPQGESSSAVARTITYEKHKDEDISSIALPVVENSNGSRLVLKWGRNGVAKLLEISWNKIRISN